MKKTQLNALGVFEDLELFDKNGNIVYKFFTISNGHWWKSTYDEKSNQLTYENSFGIKKGFDIPEFTMEELVKKIGYNFKIKK
jgi:hypothetical protein